MSMFKGPSGRGSLAGTGLKVRVSGGFKGPLRRSVPSNGSRSQPGARWLDLPLMCSTRLLPPTCLTNRWRFLKRENGFSHPSRAFPSFPDVFPSFFRSGRSTDKTLSFPPLAASSRTLITHLDAGRRRENEGRTFDICFESHCASCGERRCVAVVRSP